MLRILIFLITMAFFQSCSNSQTAGFSLLFEADVIDCPVAVNINDMFEGTPENIQLYDVTDGQDTEIPVQFDASSPVPVVWFIVAGNGDAGEARDYKLTTGGRSKNSDDATLRLLRNEKQMVVMEGDNERLAYQIADVMPPEGVDEIFKRSAHIHPLFSPSGQMLTNIQPADHYHHYGIWNPWTKTHIGDIETDYWNLGKGEGTVKTRDILFTDEGSVFGHFTALQEHIAFNLPGEEAVTTMDEFWEVRTWKSENNRYQLDLFTIFRNNLLDTILFDAYRYGGGLGYRATAKWNSQNSTVLTSEGKDRTNADASRARWCIIEGEASTGSGRSGILFMSHPDNREHPEPMRVWPPGGNNDELFFEFCPIRHKEWVILPGVDNELKYRMVVFDGQITAAEADRYWNAFAGRVSVQKK